MKKIFMNSTAIAIALGLSALMTTQLLADVAKVKKPILQISGQSKFSYHVFENNNKDIETGAPDPGEKKNNNGRFAVEDMRLNFQVHGRADWWGQMKYDWLVGLTGDEEKHVVEENRLRIKGEWGTVLVGDHQGVENFMARGAFAVMGATGGFDGTWHSNINMPTGVMLTTDLTGTTKYATKITYVTPRFFGLQAGVSFAPNSEHRAEKKPHNASSIKNNPEPFDVNSFAGGVNFEHQFPCALQVSFSATGILATTKPPKPGATGNPAADLAERNAFVFYETAGRHKTATYALGGVVEYLGFDFGIEWIDNGNSRQPTQNMGFILAPQGTPIAGFNAGKALSVAAGYAYGLDRVALGYYHSERKFSGLAKANVYSVTYDRQIAPGLSFYSEYNKFGFSTSASAVNAENAIYKGASGNAESPRKAVGGNNGYAVVFGGKIQF